MKVLFKTIAATTLLFTSLPSNAGLIYGPTARAQFEGYQTTLGDTLQTFDSFSPQTALTTQIPGLTFKTTLQRFPSQTPVDLPVNVTCRNDAFSPSCTETDKVFWGQRLGGITDGQSVYEVAFGAGMLRVGLERDWNTFSLTRFFSGATLLGEHRNTTNTEFVGFITDPANLITRIELDGLGENIGGRTVYQVGRSDDLFYGNRPESPPSVPEPVTLALFGIGLAGLGFARKKKNSA